MFVNKLIIIYALIFAGVATNMFIGAFEVNRMRRDPDYKIFYNKCMEENSTICTVEPTIINKSNIRTGRLLKSNKCPNHKFIFYGNPGRYQCYHVDCDSSPVSTKRCETYAKSNMDKDFKIRFDELVKLTEQYLVIYWFLFAILTVWIWDNEIMMIIRFLEETIIVH